MQAVDGSGSFRGILFFLISQHLEGLYSQGATHNCALLLSFLKLQKLMLFTNTCQLVLKVHVCQQYQHLYYSLYTLTLKSIYTTQYIYTYISLISLLTALILYVLYLPVKPKPISPIYTHLLTSSSVQPYTGKLIIGIYRNLSEVSPIISDNFIGSDKFIGQLFSV